MSCAPAMHSTEADDDGLVIVVDDDAGVRSALSNLFNSVGLRNLTLASADELLTLKLPDSPFCVVLDMRLREVSGLDVQSQMRKRRPSVPIIFISGHADFVTGVAAMKGGACDFIAKPFREQDLLDAVYRALDNDRSLRAKDARVHALRDRYAELSPREQEVMSLATAGLLNKQVASAIGIAEATVKIHRGQAMRKMEAKTFAELVTMADALSVRGRGRAQAAI